MMSKPKIYAFQTGGGLDRDVYGMALAEDGQVLTSHLSTNLDYLKGDLGFLETSMGKIKREKFAEHYPDGFEVIWLDNPQEDAGYMAALARNQAMFADDTEAE
jgi:hypothetical protein